MRFQVQVGSGKSIEGGSENWDSRKGDKSGEGDHNWVTRGKIEFDVCFQQNHFHNAIYALRTLFHTAI